MEDMKPEILREITEAHSPPATDETRGMTLREMVIEVRSDVKTLVMLEPQKPTRKEMYATLFTIVGLALAAAKMIF